MITTQHIPNQREGEVLKLFLRRHWITPLEIVFYMTLLIVLPGSVALYFFDRLLSYLAHPVLGPIFSIVISMYALGVWLFGFMEFTDYYLDTWIVTNERIVNIEQRGLFTRVASELHLSAIQDVTSEVRGIIHTFLDYGNVQVQTAAEKTRFIFRDIPSPEQVKETILRLVEADKKRHEEELPIDIAQQGKAASAPQAEKTGP